MRRIGNGLQHKKENGIGENGELVKKQQKAYRERNKEKIAARKRAYYAANREKLLEKQKAWNEKNKEKVRAYCRSMGHGKGQRKARREEASGFWTGGNVIRDRKRDFGDERKASRGIR